MLRRWVHKPVMGFIMACAVVFDLVVWNILFSHEHGGLTLSDCLNENRRIWREIFYD